MTNTPHPDRTFGAFLHTLRWNCVTATDPYLFQAPFRAGIRIDAYQMEPLRKALSEPIGCMYFAGEATHETLWGTVDGAWESGERAAEAALRRIGALPAAPAEAAKSAPRRRQQAPRAATPGGSFN